MREQTQIVDLEFGLTQLSGNRELLIKLLNKFKAEYVTLSDEIISLNAQGDSDSLRQIIHTVKGVSGNLGLKLLHEDAKVFEQAILQDQPTHSVQNEFIGTLNVTIEQIDLLAEQSTNASESEPNVTETSLSKLIDLLERNEYIPPHDLTNLLEEIELDHTKKDEITVAINDLDYPTALSILK